MNLIAMSEDARNAAYSAVKEAIRLTHENWKAAHEGPNASRAEIQRLELFSRDLQAALSALARPIENVTVEVRTR